MSDNDTVQPKIAMITLASKPGAEVKALVFQLTPPLVINGVEHPHILTQDDGLDCVSWGCNEKGVTEKMPLSFSRRKTGEIRAFVEDKGYEIVSELKSTSPAVRRLEGTQRELPSQEMMARHQMAQLEGEQRGPAKIDLGLKTKL